MLIEKLTTAQAAERFRVDERTIRRWIRSGRLQGYKHQGGWIVEVVGTDPLDQADGQDVRELSGSIPAGRLPAVVSGSPIAELANLAHRLGQAERTTPTSARLALAVTTAAAIAAGVLIVYGHGLLVEARARADLATSRAQLAGDHVRILQTDLHTARTERDQAVAQVGALAIRSTTRAITTTSQPTAATSQPTLTARSGSLRVVW